MARKAKAGNGVKRGRGRPPKADKEIADLREQVEASASRERHMHQHLYQTYLALGALQSAATQLRVELGKALSPVLRGPL